MDGSIEVVEAEICDADDTPVMNDRKFKLAEMLAIGNKTIYIAEFLGVSEAWVRKHKTDKEVISMIKKLQMETIEITKASLIDSTTRAVQTLNKLMEGGHAVVALAAANTTLDRVGIGVPQKDTSSSPVINLNFNNMPKEELRRNIQDRYKILAMEE